MTETPAPSKKEYSAGGIILDSGKLLIILMKTPDNQKVWTFPKGHIEKGETPEIAAVREVMEEAGYKCRIKKEIFKANYSFIRDGFNVEKVVDWFLMEKISGNGVPRAKNEIFDLKWLTIDEAEKILTYPSDLKIISYLRNNEAMPH